MSDITERLRAESARHIGRGTTDEAYPTVQVLLLTAADEIDRLRAQVRIAAGLVSTMPGFSDKHPEHALHFIEEAARESAEPS